MEFVYPGSQHLETSRAGASVAGAEKEQRETGNQESGNLEAKRSELVNDADSAVTQDPELCAPPCRCPIAAICAD